MAQNHAPGMIFPCFPDFCKNAPVAGLGFHKRCIFAGSCMQVFVGLSYLGSNSVVWISRCYGQPKEHPDDVRTPLDQP